NASEAASCVLVQSRRPLALPSSGHADLLPVPLAQFVETFRSASEAGDDDAGSILLQDWATACAMSLLAAFADSAGNLKIDHAIASRRLADSCKPWITRLLSWLEASKFAFSTGSGWRVATNAALPDPAALLRTLSKEHPGRSWELLLASRLTRWIERARADRAAPVDFALPRGLLELCEGRGTWMTEAVKLLSDALRALESLWPRERGIRILQVGFGPLSYFLASRAQAGGAQFAILVLDQRRREHAALAPGQEVELFGQFPLSATFDVIVSAGSLSWQQDPETLMSELAGALAPGGLLLAVEPGPSLFRDLVFGTNETWFAPGTFAGGGRLRTAE